MSKKIIVGIAVLGIFWAGLFYYRSLPQVEVVKAEKGAITETVEETGYIRANEYYDIQAPLSARIVAINAVNDQAVQAGQVIMTLQNLDLEAQLAIVRQSIAVAEADLQNQQSLLQTMRLDLEEAKQDLERKASLFAGGGVSKVEYNLAQAQEKKLTSLLLANEAAYNGAESRLEALNSQLASMNQQEQELQIISPIDAKVLALPVKNGQLVSAGTVLTTVGTPGRLEVYLEVLSDKVVDVEPGQLADITFAGSDGQTLSGKVKEVYPQAFEKMSALGVSQRLVPVIVTLDRNGPLKPGFEVQVAIQTASQHDVLRIPRESVIAGTDGENRVRVVSANRVETREVSIGLKNQFLIEVKDGLKSGDLVVRDGSLRLEDNTRIRQSK